MNKTKIIVVEDNIVYCEYVCNMLSRDGSPKYEDTCVYAILEKEWNTIHQW